MSDALISIFFELAFVMRNTVGMYFVYWGTKEPNDNKILFAKVANISKRTNISKTKAYTLYSTHRRNIFAMLSYGCGRGHRPWLLLTIKLFVCWKSSKT